MMKMNNGIFTTAQVTNEGISRRTLKLLLNEVLLKKQNEGFTFYLKLGVMKDSTYSIDITKGYSH